MRIAPLLLIAGALLVAGIAAARASGDAARIELGRRLFYDADLSADGSMSCATCHEQHRGFGDGNRSHPGVHGDPARRNVPGLANLAGLKRYTWADPRIRTLEAQVLVPVFGEAPVEMGMRGRESEIAARLARDPCYPAQFAKAFPTSSGRIDMPTIARALAAFERTLVSRDAPYDRGKLDATAQRGATIFARDCAGCHAGPLFSDGRYHRILPIVAADRGVGEVTGRTGDDGKFRTPSLRNVAVTAPYFHDGSAATLRAAIERHPGTRSADEVAGLVAFLEALTDRGFLIDKRFGYPERGCERQE